MEVLPSACVLQHASLQDFSDFSVAAYIEDTLWSSKLLIDCHLGTPLECAFWLHELPKKELI